MNYVGEFGGNIWSTQDINAPINPAVNPVGPFGGPLAFPYLFHITEQRSFAESFYNGLEVQFEQHASHGLSFLASYTYSHSTNDAQKPDDGYHLTNLWGNTAFDLRHRLTLTTTYDIPGPRGDSAVLRNVLGGWSLNSILTLETGLP